MNKIINVGVIGSEMSEEFFQLPASANHQKYHYKKIYTETGAQARQFPEAELVSDVNEILNDGSIELVIVSPAHINRVSQLIRAGKAVRVSDTHSSYLY